MTETTSALSTTERDRIHRLNYYVFLADFVLFGIGINFISASTVIPDYVRKLTSLEILIGFSGSMFEFGWLLPQLLIARRLMQVERKKWWFIGPNIPVRLLMIVYAGIIFLSGAENVTLLLILFLIFYGLAALGDGLVGVPWIDLLGSSLDDKRRARLFGLGNAVVGIGVLASTPIIRTILSANGPGFPNNYGMLFLIAGCCFLITVPAMLWVKELPDGKPRETAPPLHEYLPDLIRILRKDQPFRAMISTRILGTLFTLAGPFYIGFATERLDLASENAVPTLLFMLTLGSVSASLLYSRFGAQHNLFFIRLALVMGLLMSALALLAGVIHHGVLYAAFFCGGVSSGTLYLSFINWLIAYSIPEQRPIYTGLFNSVSAGGLLLAPIIGGLVVQWVSYEAAFGAALVIMACAVYVSLRYVVEP
jgi:MFS family permease